VKGLLLSLAFLVLASPATSGTLTFDFQNGPGPLFDVFNDGGLWTVDTDGPSLRISKPADDLTVMPGNIRAGVKSTFPLMGDFVVTVDYNLFDVPADLSHTETYNLIEFRLETAADPDHENFDVIRFRQYTSQEIEAWQIPPGVIYGRQSCPSAILVQGRMRLSRVGTTISTYWAPVGSESFTLLGAAVGIGDPLYIRLVAAQSRTCTCQPQRANTSLDVEFDNLIVVADELPVPTARTTWGGIKALF
jgi:hypothetical protein